MFIGTKLLLQFFHISKRRFLTTRTPRITTNRTTTKSKETGMAAKHQVHKEIMRHISPFSLINIRSDLFLKVRPADVHTYPDADAFIAELHGSQARNCTAALDVKVNEEENVVNVEIQKLKVYSDFHCELLVPIKAKLRIIGNDAVHVEHMQGDELIVNALGDIRTCAIRCEAIKLKSGGNVKCEGTLLGRSTTINAQGSIILDKLQGDSLQCKTVDGDITTNCCYSEHSKFETDCGTLNLKNVHKKSDVLVHGSGALEMIGFHGYLNAFIKNGTSIKIQLSELTDETSRIQIDDASKAANIKISEQIAAHTHIEVDADNILIDPENETKDFNEALSSNQKQFILNADNPLEYKSKLKIEAKNCTIHLGKSSWMQMMQASMCTNNPQSFKN